MERAKGCLTVLALLFGLMWLSIVIHLFILTWPVCLPAGLAAIGWFITRGSEKPISNAAHAVLGPVTIGLLLTAALLLLFKLQSTSTNVVRGTERALVYLDNRVPASSKLSLLVFVAVIVCLTALAYWMPRLKLVAKFAALNKISLKATVALGAATSFTFFSNVAVVQPKVPGIYLKIEAVYRNSKEGQRKAVDRFLAAKAVQCPESSEREYCRLIIDGVAAIPTMDLVAKQSLAGYVAQHLYHDINLPENSALEVSSLPHRSALTMLDRQLATERAANDFASEAVKAANESLDFGHDQLKDIVWSFIDKLIGEQADAVDQLARPFIDEIIDKYFEKYTDPIVTKQAEAVRRLFEHPGNGHAAAKIAANRETQSAMALMNAREAESARSEARQAVEAAHAAEADAKAGDTAKVDADVATVRSASVQARKDADLAKAASESMAKLSLTLEAEPKETGVAMSAIGAIEAAQAMRIATETAEAAKAAEAALEAAEAAKAARDAAEAAEAAEVFLKVVPK